MMLDATDRQPFIYIVKFTVQVYYYYLRTVTRHNVSLHKKVNGTALKFQHSVAGTAENKTRECESN